MATYVMRNGSLVDKSTGEPMPQRERHEWTAPRIASDWEAIESPIDGKVYEGRKAYLEHLKRHDCVIVGNDMPRSRYGGPGGHARYKGGSPEAFLPIREALRG